MGALLLRLDAGQDKRGGLRPSAKLVAVMQRIVWEFQDRTIREAPQPSGKVLDGGAAKDDPISTEAWR